ncbi:MAG TPA: very short patch repair endonuclease [Verrucomicrobiae bacterium]|nr:very short patch repair endonuclease [Verrucomicrobiae bacterium]
MRRPSQEVTTFGRLSRSELMSRIRSSGNLTTEIRLARLLRKSHMAGWRRGLAIPGQPDFAWPVLKVAVFVDGCFWHGHDCDRNLKPKRNARYWQEKIQRNVARDRRVSRRLKKNGWTVIRIWECMLTKSPTRCLNQIGTALRRAETRQSVLARVS